MAEQEAATKRPIAHCGFLEHGNPCKTVHDTTAKPSQRSSRVFCMGCAKACFLFARRRYLKVANIHPRVCFRCFGCFECIHGTCNIDARPKWLLAPSPYRTWLAETTLNPKNLANRYLYRVSVADYFIHLFFLYSSLKLRLFYLSDLRCRTGHL
jgi:hypothetical protein